MIEINLVKHIFLFCLTDKRFDKGWDRSEIFVLRPMVISCYHGALDAKQRRFQCINIKYHYISSSPQLVTSSFFIRGCISETYIFPCFLTHIHVTEHLQHSFASLLLLAVFLFFTRAFIKENVKIEKKDPHVGLSVGWSVIIS